MVSFRLEAIIPGHRYKGKKLVKELRRVTKNSQEQARRDFKSTVASWDKKPTFFVRRTGNAEFIEIVAGTDSEFYAMLDQGTRPHTITPVVKRILSFNPNYVAKTQVGILKARPGGSVGGQVALARKVLHPGTEARNWAILIAEKIEIKWQVDLDKAVEGWVDRTHSRARIKKFFK